MAVWLEYGGQVIPLPPGESLVGRAKGCRLRFNDPTVSRAHVRLVLEGRRLLIEDLGSTSGSAINDRPLLGRPTLADGDVVRIGNRRFTVRVGQTFADWGDEQTSDGGWQEHADGAEHELVAEDAPTQHHNARSLESVRTRKQPALATAATAGGATTASTLRVAADEQSGAGIPSTDERLRLPTLELKPVEGVVVPQNRRRHERWQVELAALYSSPALSFHGLVRDLSSGGVFIASDVLDAIGVKCRIDVFPQSQRTVSFQGTVRHIISAAEGRGGLPPGLGVQFTQIDSVAKRWLDEVLSGARSE